MLVNFEVFGVIIILFFCHNKYCFAPMKGSDGFGVVYFVPCHLLKIIQVLKMATKIIIVDLFINIKTVRQRFIAEIKWF